MKSTPIIFSGPMVRAILEGRKTVTRRLVQSKLAHPIVSVTEHGPFKGEPANLQSWSFDHLASTGSVRVEQGVRCPYGLVGDQLWVKEAFAFKPRNPRALDIEDVTYREAYVSCPDPTPRWRSPLFMPRWASRLTLEIVAVRVERLQEISEEDARAEGVLVLRDGRPCDPRTGFSVGWDKINGKRAPWSSNPWVWVIEFRKVEQSAAQRSAEQ